jgi:hypothetical protein
MTERVHPEDLRAQIALEIYKLAALAPDSPDDPGTRKTTLEWSVQTADLLLAELARTAKPDPLLVDAIRGIDQQRAREEGAREKQTALAPFLRHWPDCPGYLMYDGRGAMEACNCGLRAALEPKPETTKTQEGA